MKVGPIKTFQTVIDTLVECVLKTADALRGDKPYCWFLSKAKRSDTDGGDDPIDPTKEEDLKTIFDRSELDDIVKRVYEESDVKVVELVSAEVQTNWLGAAERDFRLRYRPRLRIVAHEQRRRMTQGDDEGSIRRGVELALARIGKQGKEIS